MKYTQIARISLKSKNVKVFQILFQEEEEPPKVEEGLASPDPNDENILKTASGRIVKRTPRSESIVKFNYLLLKLV